MNIMINRLDPHVPDPVESRRRAAGRLVRMAYGASVFGVLAFFVVYFGAPLVLLSGPGTVSSARHIVSLPYVVQVSEIRVTPGAAVKVNEEIGQVRSPEQDNIVATYMRAMSDIASRRAEIRIKTRVAQESLETARAYREFTEGAADRLEASSVASLAFRIEIFRERVQARKAVVSQEAEIAEAITQLADLDEFNQQLRERLDQLERGFAGGRVVAPVAGILSTNLAYAGQSLLAGTPVAEILDPTDVFVDWYISNERLFNPKVGNNVLVLFGNRRIAGKIAEILPVSDVYAGKVGLLARDRPATQIARIRFLSDAEAPALNSTVYVHMYYADLTARAAGWLVELFGLQ